MNNREYLEYEGSRLLDYVLQTFHPGGSGDLTYDMEKVLLKETDALSSEMEDKLQDFFWEYVLFRLYISSCMIQGHQDGFGSQAVILSGMREMLSDIPSYLKVLSIERDLAGSYLLIGRRASTFSHDYVQKQFTTYRSIEESYHGISPKKEARHASIAASLMHIADSLSFPMTDSLLAFLEEETLSYMKSLSARLARVTPEGIRERAHQKTLVHSHGSTFCQETYDHLYPSFTLLASMLAGLLVMFA